MAHVFCCAIRKRFVNFIWKTKTRKWPLKLLYAYSWVIYKTKLSELSCWCCVDIKIFFFFVNCFCFWILTVTDKTFLELGYRKKSWFISNLPINYLRLSLASANNSSAINWQISKFWWTHAIIELLYMETGIFEGIYQGKTFSSLMRS